MESMKTALRKWLKAKDFKKQLSALQSLDRVKKVFKQILPPELQVQVRPIRLDNDLIIVAVSRPIWFNELKFYEKRILAELAKSNIKVRAIETRN